MACLKAHEDSRNLYGADVFTEKSKYMTLISRPIWTLSGVYLGDYLTTGSSSQCVVLDVEHIIITWDSDNESRFSLEH